MSFEKEDLRRSTGSPAELAESPCYDDDRHSMGRYPRLAWNESARGVGVGKASEKFIPNIGQQRLLRYETSSAGSWDSSKKDRRCRGRSFKACFGSPVWCPAAAAVVAVAILLLVAASAGLAFVVSGLHEKVNDLETKITKCAVENAPMRRMNHHQRFEAFDSSEEIADEPEGLFDTTMKLINSHYDNDEPEPTAEVPAAELTTPKPIGSDMETRGGDVIKMDGVHSRVRRDAVQGGGPKSNKKASKQMNQTTAVPAGAKSFHEKKGHVNLDSSHFEVDFYKDWYDSQTHFPVHECIIDERWPTKPEACRGKTIKYRESDSPLAFYVPRNNTSDKSAGHKKRKRKTNNLSPMEITDKSNGVFGVRESGVYLIHLHIMIVDESHNHSLGISLNSQTVLTCPKGGFRCPQINEEGSYKYRVCVIDGVLEINPGDRLQIKTMEKDTMVKFHTSRTSQFKAILLHKTRT